MKSKAAAYLVMAGVPRLMEARYKRLPPPSPGDGNCIGKRDATNRTGRCGGNNATVNAAEEWDETEEWEREIANNPGLLDGIP